MQASSASVRFIFITILLDVIGLGLLIPNFPDIIRRFVSEASTVSEYYGYFISIYALMQFLASPILGGLSDQFGRRPILLASLFGAAIDYLFMAFAPTLGLMYVGRIISGLTGASQTVASSYMADVSTDKNRAANFGMIGAAWGIGFVLGPAMGGALSQIHYTAPFLAAAGMNFANFLFGLFVLPESLKLENRRPVDVWKLNPLGTFRKIFRKSSVSILVLIYMIVFLAGQVHPSTWTLYTQFKFHWSALEVGLSLAFVGVTFGVSQAILPRYLVPRIGEPLAITIGLLVYVFGFLGFGFATYGWSLYAMSVLFAFSGLMVPSLQSLATKRIPANEQGEFQGTLVSVGSLTSIVAPIVFTRLFTEFTRKDALIIFPGASYLAASLLCVLALGIWLIAKRKLKV